MPAHSVQPGHAALFHFDDAGGRRLYLVLTCGPAWVTLLELSTVRRIKIRRAQAFRAFVRPVDLSRTRIKCTLRRKRAEFRRLNVHFSQSGYRLALRTLEGEAG